MDLFALHLFLLLGTLSYYDSQITATNPTGITNSSTAQITATNPTGITNSSTVPVTATNPTSITNSSTGCAGPPALCCPGQNNSCFRGCYCDQACILLKDCCADYTSTCPQSSSSTYSNTSSTQVAVTTVSSTGAVSQSTSAATSTPSDGSKISASTATGTTLSEASTTSLPADGHNFDKTLASTTSSDTDSQTVILKIRASLLSSDENKDEVVEALSNFLSDIFPQLNCENCAIRVSQRKLT